MRTLIAFTGYARTGKDSACAYLVRTKGFMRVGFADALKDVLYDLNPLVSFDGDDWDGDLRVADLVDRVGWERAKENPEIRQLLQRLGVAVRENVSEDVWVDAALRETKDVDKVCVSDCRFVNEANAVYCGDGYVVRILRPGYGPVNGHVSESDMDSYPVDAEIINDGTLDELGDEVERVLEELGVG